MDWEEMCKVELPVPDIEKQRKIVKAYKDVYKRQTKLFTSNYNYNLNIIILSL